MKTCSVVLATTGRTAAGKTTLSKSLAQSLDLYYVPEAAFKRVLRPGYSTQDSLDESLRDIAYGAAVGAAGRILSSGQTPIIDASFHKARRRCFLLDMAQAENAATIFLYCRCDDQAETGRRIEGRRGSKKDYSTHADSIDVYSHIDSGFEEIDITEFGQVLPWAVIRIDTYANIDRGLESRLRGSQPIGAYTEVVRTAVASYLEGQRRASSGR